MASAGLAKGKIMPGKRVLLVYGAEEGHGVLGKLNAIERGFREAGCELFALRTILSRNKWIRVLQMAALPLRFLTCIVARRYSLIYIRHGYMLIPVFLVCKMLRIAPFLELNTKEEEEFLSRGQRIRCSITAMSLRIAFSCSRKVFCVTGEILEHYRGRAPLAEFVLNPNFVTDPYYQPRLEGVRKKINFVFLGNANQRWQGLDLFVDKVICGNDWFRQNCMLHVVGACGGWFQDMIDRDGLTDVIELHGFLTGPTKIEIMAQMDIGIGCFDLGKKGLTSATSIKVGEYLYAGLPVILGSPDDRLEDGSGFVLYLDLLKWGPETIGSLRSFVETVTSDGRISREAHAFAKRTMTVSCFVRRILGDELSDVLSA